MAGPGFGLKEPFPGFPPPLTTRPEGLLSMLGIQTNGKYPQHLETEQLTPALDLLPWYLESRAEVSNVLAQPITMTVLGQFQSLWQVPANQVWILLAASVAGAALATPITLQLARARNNDFESRLALSAPVAFQPSFPIMYSDASVRHLIFRPSVHIGLNFVAGGFTGNTFNATLRFVRCQI